jgi:hypothetical protein
MTDKKKRILDIRGWFPQEPYLISKRSRLIQDKSPPPIMPAYKLSTVKFTVVFTIFWMMFYGYMLFTSFSAWYTISGLQIAAWAIAGSLIGILSGWGYNRNQLKRLASNYQISVNGTDMALLVVPFILFVVFCFLAAWSMPIRLGVVLQGLLISVYGWGSSEGITRTVLLAYFERKENMCIMQSWWDSGLVLIPRAPDSFSNHSGASNRKDSIRSQIKV